MWIVIHFVTCPPFPPNRNKRAKTTTPKRATFTCSFCVLFPCEIETRYADADLVKNDGKCVDLRRIFCWRHKKSLEGFIHGDRFSGKTLTFLHGGFFGKPPKLETSSSSSLVFSFHADVVIVTTPSPPEKVEKHGRRIRRRHRQGSSYAATLVRRARFVPRIRVGVRRVRAGIVAVRRAERVRG